MREIDKMEAGDWYDANYDQELVDLRRKAQDLCFELNHLKPSQGEERKRVQDQLIGESFPGLEIISPFYCDYGNRITFGKHCFVNLNCYFMDGGTITIGDYAFIGPNTGFYTAHHPLNYHHRNQGLEKALPIFVGNHVWIGAHVTVLPGVTIGDGCVIGAGSVVTEDIPDNSLATGVPCRVIRPLDQDPDAILQ